MNDREPTYDFLRDAEELRRMRSDPGYRAAKPAPLLERKERYELGALVSVVLLVNLAAILAILIS